MVILLAGGEGRFMDALINKFNKDGHRVYLLTGSRSSQTSYRKVFERYNFNYDSESIRTIMASTNPDVVIFTGAQDTHYEWENARKDGVQYAADLTNIMSSYASVRKGRFIYLSSQEVFGSSCSYDIKEDEPTSAVGFRALAISQGEEMCKSYYSSSQLEAVNVRIDQLYGTPIKGRSQRDQCFKLTLEMLKGNPLLAGDHNVFSMLHQKDAVEFVYRIATAETLKHQCYHLSSGRPISQLELARLIKSEGNTGTELEEESTGTGNRIVLSSDRFDEEFGRKIFVGYDEGVKDAVQYMKRYAQSFITPKAKDSKLASKFATTVRRLMGLLIPYIENLICFIPFFMLNNRAVGSQYFNKIDFYLLYVLLFAVVYGQNQAIFSALLAIAGYCFRQMYTKTGFEVLMDYNTYVWMAQLFIVGMIVGYMRDQIRYIKNQDIEEIDYLHGQLGDIEDINDSNVRMKHNFERQIVNQKDSLGKIYEVTSRLDQRGPEEVLFYAARVLSELMETDDAAIYTVANRSFARLFSFTSATAKKLGKSICYTDMTDMYSDLKDHRVFINKTMDERYPLMACAIYSEDEMQTIIMLWGLPWERMTLAEANRLTVVGYLIQNAVVRAGRYLDSLRNRRYIEDTDVLDEEAFSQLVAAFFDARRQGLTECALVKIKSKSEDIKDAAFTLKGKIRQSDYLGILKGELYALLSNTDESGAAGVAERFIAAGLDSEVVHREVSAA